MDEDSDISINSLKDIMEEEREKRKVIRQRNLGCYSQFSGTFTRFSLVSYPPELIFYTRTDGVLVIV